MALPRRYRPYKRQAKAQTRLRYGAEANALKDLSREARGDLRRSVNTSAGIARSLVSALSQQPEQVERIYSETGLTPEVRENLAGASPFQQRQATEMAMADRELVDRQVQAREGAAFAINTAVKNFRSDIKDINRQRTRLANEAGLYGSTLLEQLIGEDRAARAEAKQQRRDQRFQANQNAMNRANQQAVSLIGKGVDPATGQVIPGVKEQQNAKDAQDAAEKRAAKREKKREAKVKETREGVQKVTTAATLWRRYGDMTVEVDGKKRKASPEEVETRLIEEGYSKRQIDIARDLIRNNGRLSKRGVRAMKELGLFVPKRWRPEPYTPSGPGSDAAQG